MDTVNFRLTTNDVKGVDFLEETPCYIDNVAVHNYGGDIVVTGNLNGLKVTANRSQVRVKDGSLCKWYLGDNYQTMTRGDVERAIEKLSDLLHLPMENATVTRLDVAHNIFTKHPTSVYFNHLGELRYARRLMEPSGLYYSRANERLCFYDKNTEQRTRGEAIPELYADSHVLRYEQRYLHRLPKQLGVEAVTGAMLYDEAFYIRVQKQWRETYKAIEKINDRMLNLGIMKGKKQLYKMGVLALVERAGGQIEMMSQINEAQSCGQLTTKEAYDLRKAVKEACTMSEGVIVRSEEIAELDRKIGEAILYYR